MEKKYKPIDCNWYDEFTLWVIRKTKVEIHLNEEEKKAPIKTVIKDIYTRSKAEYILLEDGQEIRMDRIEKVIEI